MARSRRSPRPERTRRIKAFVVLKAGREGSDALKEQIRHLSAEASRPA